LQRRHNPQFAWCSASNPSMVQIMAANAGGAFVRDHARAASGWM